MSWGADSTAAQWDALHIQPRHRLAWPSEHAVRFLSGVKRGVALDIGCGSGRHCRLLRDGGFDLYATDVSYEAVFALRLYGFNVSVAPMTELPCGDETVDVALSYGVFYYGTKEDHRAAIAEMHRVLRPGGRALVCIRRHDDWHVAHTHDGVFYCEGEPEDGMQMHFLTEYEVRTYYAAFSELTLNWTKTTRGSRCDSEWLIALTK